MYITYMCVVFTVSIFTVWVILVVFNIYIIRLFYKVNYSQPVYIGHSREPENMPFKSSCPLYTD